MKKLLFITLLLSVIILNSEVITISPSSDLYTDLEHQGTPNANGELWVANYVPAGQFQRIMIDFEADDYFNSSFGSAILHLTRFYSCPSSGSTVVRIYPIAEDWNEANWNIHQHVAFHENIYKEVLLSGPGGANIEHFSIDMTNILSQVMDNELEFYGFVMIANSNQKFSKFYSKEHNNVANRPTLEITSSPVSNENVNTIITSQEITAFPNPFNPTTTIEFDNPLGELVEVAIYNIRGRLVKTVSGIEVNGEKNRVMWNGLDDKNKKVSSGIYLCQVKIGNDLATAKLVLQK